VYRLYDAKHCCSTRGGLTPIAAVILGLYHFSLNLVYLLGTGEGSNIIPHAITMNSNTEENNETIICKDCDGELAPAVAANPYFSGSALRCTACGVLCDGSGQPIKVSVGGSVPQRIYEMAGAVMTEAELLSTVAEEDEVADTF